MSNLHETRIDFTNEIHRNQEAGSFLLDVVQMDFDVERLVADYHNILGNYAIRSTPRPSGSVLQSISLTHRPGATDPMYDGNNSQFVPGTSEKLFLEKDFTEFNEDFNNTAFRDVYDRMPFRVGRMRLNLLPPVTVFDMHKDSAPRAHVSLITNPDCFLTSGDGQAHHIPADGNLYVFDTTQSHTAFNASREDRIHITIALADEEK